MRNACGLGVVIVAMLLGTGVAFADAKSLLQRRTELEKERDRHEANSQEQPGDRTGVSTVTSTGSEHCSSIGGGLQSCTTSSSTGTQGGLSATARGRIGIAKINKERVEAQIAEINAQLAGLPPEEVLAAGRELGLVNDGPTSDQPGVGEDLFRLTVEMVARAFVPSAGSWEVNGRILGEGQYGEASGIQGNGYTIGGSTEVVRTRGTVGFALGVETELGQYKEHGVIGSIGGDAGLGLRGRKSYVSLTIGIHKTASIYHSARWVPLLVHAGIRGRSLSMSFVGGYGWRPALPADGSPESMIISKGPLGSNSSLFKLMFGIGLAQIGLEYQDLDGLRIGSFVAGIGYLGGIDGDDK